MEILPAQKAALIPASEPRCLVCRSDQRQDIENALLTPGASMRAVARRFGLILSNLQRHRPHMGAAMDAARALREVESLGTLYKRQQSRSEEMREAAQKALLAGQFQAYSQIMEVARKYEEMLSKYGQTPGFREPNTGTQINAPEARIVVTSTPVRRALPPGPQDPDHD